MKTHLPAGGLVLLLLLLLACSTKVAGPDGSTAGDDASAEAVPAQASGPEASATKLTAGGVTPSESDTLLLYYGDDPDTVNPLTANDTVSDAFQRWVYEGLADQDFHDPDQFKPSLAERWEFDEKDLEYTIHLRRGVKWHPMTLPNGKPLPPKEFTARDVKFTFDCILNPHIDAASLRSYYEDPEAKDESEKYKIKVTLVDDYTVKVRWTKPYFLAKDFTLGIAIIPRHVYSVDEKGEPISFDFSSKEFADGFNNHWANTKMCGTGPMIFTEWQKNQRVVLVRNPDYWGKPFYFAKAIYRCIPNPNTALQQLLQNDLDYGAIPQKDHYMQSKAHKNVKAGKVKLIEYDYPAYRYIGYNFKREFLKDERVRWALGHAIPVQKIIDEVLKGLGRPLSGPFLPGSSACDESIRVVDYDLEKAKRLLDEAGWKDTDGNGVRDKKIGGVKHEARYDLMIYADSPDYRTIAEVIKEDCRKIGVEVLISPAKWALMLQKLRKKEFDAAMLGWALSWRGDPFQIWHGSQADVPDSSNSISYRNPELDKLIEELRVTMDEKKQVALYHRIHRIIYQDQPYTFLFVDKATGARDARLENIKFYKIRPCVNASEWFASNPRILGQKPSAN